MTATAPTSPDPTLCRGAGRHPCAGPVQIRAHHHQPAIGRNHPLADGRSVLNFCANNYLGLADPDIIAAARTRWTATVSAWPRCVSSAARRIYLKQLERTIADFFGKQDTILYAACFDANGGQFRAAAGRMPRHRLLATSSAACACAKTGLYRYQLRQDRQLKQAEGPTARAILITTDGAFPCGRLHRPLDDITALAAKYGALVSTDATPASFGRQRTLFLKGVLLTSCSANMGGRQLHHRQRSDRNAARQRGGEFSNSRSAAAAKTPRISAEPHDCCRLRHQTRRINLPVML